MKFSSKAKYGLRVVCELGKSYENSEPISSTKLASIANVSQNYLEKIMSTLKKENIVTSKQGLNGGYELNIPPKELTIGKILTALEGSLYTSECVERKCENKNCPNKEVFSFIYKSINETLNKITLQDIINKKV